MVKHRVPGGLGDLFARAQGRAAHKIRPDRLRQRGRAYSKRENIKVGGKVFPARQKRQVSGILLRAEHVVHEESQDLRRQIIGRDGHEAREHARDQIPFTAPQQAEERFHTISISEKRGKNNLISAQFTVHSPQLKDETQVTGIREQVLDK